MLVYISECVVEDFGQRGAVVKHCVCCIEADANECQHNHMAVKLERIRRWEAVKNYLKDKHEIIVHFSNAHDNYYSAWKYVTKEDEEVLQSSDHPYLWNSKPPGSNRASETRTSQGRLWNSPDETEQSEAVGLWGFTNNNGKRRKKNRYRKLCGQPRVAGCRRSSWHGLGNKIRQGKIGAFKLKQTRYPARRFGWWMRFWLPWPLVLLRSSNTWEKWHRKVVLYQSCKRSSRQRTK